MAFKQAVTVIMPDGPEMTRFVGALVLAGNVQNWFSCGVHWLNVNPVDVIFTPAFGYILLGALGLYVGAMVSVDPVSVTLK